MLFAPSSTSDCMTPAPAASKLQTVPSGTCSRIVPSSSLLVVRTCHIRGGGSCLPDHVISRSCLSVVGWVVPSSRSVQGCAFHRFSDFLQPRSEGISLPVRDIYCCFMRAEASSCFLSSTIRVGRSSLSRSTTVSRHACCFS